MIQLISTCLKILMIDFQKKEYVLMVNLKKKEKKFFVNRDETSYFSEVHGISLPSLLVYPVLLVGAGVGEG